MQVFNHKLIYIKNQIVITFHIDFDFAIYPHFKVTNQLYQIALKLRKIEVKAIQ